MAGIVITLLRPFRVKNGMKVFSIRRNTGAASDPSSTKLYNSSVASGLPPTHQPAAFAVGIATISPSGKVLDTRYPVVNFGQNFKTASALAKVLGHSHSRTSTHRLDPAQLDEAAKALGHIAGDEGYGPKKHPNLTAWRHLLNLTHLPPPPGGQRALVATFIDALTDEVHDVHDIYLRLHLLSHRHVKPHGINLGGMWAKLNTVVWTNTGPFEVNDFESVRLALDSRTQNQGSILVHSVDKFPRMTDYVVPSGVRIADASRVRLGAHLSEGTVVMQEGFCNANAGTLGASMIEGRISAGVVIGEGSDVGGGASIMGTLSGGGQEVISIGKGCLIGANAGVGISLGDGCVVEAGLYVTAGSKVKLPDGQIVAARLLSGKDGILFRRNSQAGAIEALPYGDGAKWGGLNSELHT